MNLRALAGLDEQPMPGFRGATGISATPWYDQGILGTDLTPMSFVNALPLAGAMLGTGLAAPTGPAAVGGAALGGAGGESLRQLITRALAGAGRAPQTPQDAAKEIGTQALWQAVGEATGQMLPARGTIRELTAYHGSPHTFDKFDMSKVGTGEGAQAYGHGLYFAEAPDTAKSYMMAGRNPGDFKEVLYKGESYPFGTDKARLLAETAKNGRAAVVQDLESEIARLKNYAPDRAQLLESHIPFVKSINPDNVKIVGGTFYHVDIPDEHVAKMLDWDKPLSEQPEAVRAGLRQVKLEDIGITVDPVATHPGMFSVNTPRGMLGYIGKKAESLADLGSLGKDSLYDSVLKDPVAAQALRDAGIPGIKYLDQGSRGAGTGTRNFVLFDDSIPKILKRE